jgi:hypothetical protein
MPSSEPILTHRHGRDVWTDVEMDALRVERCPCLRCGRLRSGTDENCPTASALYSLCKMSDVAMMITRCAAWEPKAPAEPATPRQRTTRAELNRALALGGERMEGDVWCGAARGVTTEVIQADRAVVVRVDVPPSLNVSLDRFRKNPMVMLDHDYEGLPIARCLWEHVRFDGEEARPTLTAKVQFHLDTELSREAWLCAKNYVLSYWDVGVIPTEWGADHVVTRADLIDVSLVPSHEDELDEMRRLLRERAITAPSLVRSLEQRGLLDDKEVTP